MLYIAARKYYQATGEASGSYDLRRIIAAKGYPKLIVDGARRLLEDLEVELLVEDVEYMETINVATSLKLLPSDAIIALTCKHLGIGTMPTFDEDFKRVPWLKIAPSFQVPSADRL